MFLANYPINGIGATLSAIFAPIFGVIFLLLFIYATKRDKISLFITLPYGILIILGALLPLFARLYSYYKYEKILKK